jgi:glycosyltransferase involved in cell wall biosynthesis
MLSGKNIICIANTAWEGNYSKTIVEMMSVLARNNHVFFVDYPYTVKDVLWSFFGKIKIPLKRVLGFSSRIKQLPTREGHTVFVHTLPPVMPVNFLPAGFLFRRLLQFNGWIIRRSVRRGLKKAGLHSADILVNAFNPVAGISIGKKLNEKILLYYCYDEIEGANWMNKHGGWTEKELIKICDAVIVSSPALFEKKKPGAKHCCLIRNAVDYQLFSAGFSQVNERKRKRVGYIGSIDDRLDYDLLEYLFKSLPDYQFEFTGRTIYPEGYERLKKYANVSIFEPRPLQELPALLAQYGAGIIPFACNEFTKGIYPLKINEYLAAGLPVVLTDFGQLGEFASIAKITATNEAFKTELVNALSTDTNELRTKRNLFAKTNSWDSRLEDFSVLVSQLQPAD